MTQKGKFTAEHTTVCSYCVHRNTETCQSCDYWDFANVDASKDHTLYKLPVGFIFGKPSKFEERK